MEKRTPTVIRLLSLPWTWRSLFFFPEARDARGQSASSGMRWRVLRLGLALCLVMALLCLVTWSGREESGQESLVTDRAERVEVGLLPGENAPRIAVTADLTGRSSWPALGPVQLTHGSREIHGPNSVFLILDQPVIKKGTTWTLSARDYAATYEPLKTLPLRGRTAEHMGRWPKILLDPGHGGIDSGAFVAGIKEKEISLELAFWTAYWLEQMGFEVDSTRTDDRWISLEDRAQMAISLEADLFVSLHCNASDSTQPRGVEVYVRPLLARSFPSSELAGREFTAAWEILNRLSLGVSANMRGLRRGNFQVLRDAGVPAVLIEYGFLTNAEDRRDLTDSRYQIRVSAATALAIRDWALRVF
jgi:N-acetylmuramoyl-L-alanine amidase